MPTTTPKAQPRADMHAFDRSVVLLTHAKTPITTCLADDLASRGARLVLHDQSWNQSDVSAQATDLVLRSNAALESADAAAGLIAETTEHFGTLTTLITGIPDVDMSDSAFESAEWGAVIQRHISEPLNITRAAVSAMDREDSASIVNMASSAGLLAAPGSLVLSTISAAILGFNRTLSREQRESNIAVNAVSPIVQNETGASIYGASRLSGDDFAPQEICAAIAYVCDPQSGLHGELLSVGGGRFGRYVTSATPGFFKLEASVEDIQANIGQVLKTDNAIELKRAVDELQFIDV